MKPFVPERHSPLTLAGQVQRDLRRHVEGGHFAPGSRIPSEHVLAEHYGVSRTTIRSAIAALAQDGYLESRRGAGTFVRHGGLVKFDIDLLGPWREQLLAEGHVARSRLISYAPDHEVSADLLHAVQHDRPERFSFGLHVQEVDGIPIALTESWLPGTDRALATSAPGETPATAHSWIELSSADGFQAGHLRLGSDANLIVITTCARQRSSGELVELARTSWVASRVRMTYRRSLTLGDIDMTDFLSVRRRAASRS